MIIYVDIDGTICNNTYGDYDNAEPFRNRIEKNNKLYDEGNTIIYHTARGMGRTNNNVIKAYQIFYAYTSKQLDRWGVKYHELHFGKPYYDLFIDDKNINSDTFFNIKA